MHVCRIDIKLVCRGIVADCDPAVPAILLPFNRINIFITEILQHSGQHDLHPNHDLCFTGQIRPDGNRPVRARSRRWRRSHNLDVLRVCAGYDLFRNAAYEYGAQAERDQYSQKLFQYNHLVKKNTATITAAVCNYGA